MRVVGGSVGAIAAFLFSILLHSFGMFADQRNALGAMAGMGIGSIGLIILVPLAIVIGLVYRRCHCSSLFDDCRRSEPTI